MEDTVLASIVLIMVLKICPKYDKGAGTKMHKNVSWINVTQKVNL